MSIIQSGHFVQITPISGLFQSNIYSVTSISKQPSLITIFLQNVSNASDGKTVLISSNGYVIKGETQKYQLRFESDSSKFQDVRTSRQIGTGSLKFAMTGVEPIDINILIQMDDQTLSSACQTDRYISSLCQKDALWLQKIQLKFPGAVQFKDIITNYGLNFKILNLKEYYVRLNNILPNQEGAKAAKAGHLEVLKWMASLNPPIYPDKNGAIAAASSGRLDVLKWMASLNPPIYPDQYAANMAAWKGHLDVLKWMASLTPPVLPDENAVNEGALRSRRNVISWLREQGIHPF